MTNCLTIENTTDYLLFTTSRDDNEELRQQLQEPVHQQNVRVLHLMMDNGRRHVSTTEASFAELMVTISCLPHLMDVTLSMHKNRTLPVSALVTLVQNATQLQGLHLHDLSLEPDASPYLLGEWLQQHPHLCRVSLIRCHVRPVHVLLQALVKMPRLQQLQLDGTVLEKQVNADAMLALTQLVGSSSSSLQSLTLIDLKESGMTRQLLAMMQALEHPPPHVNSNSNSNRRCLTDLNLQVALYESLPPAMVPAVATMIRHNRSLQRLTVPSLGGGEVWLPVVQALRHNTRLVEFRYWNPPSSGAMTKKGLSHHLLQTAVTVLRDSTTLEYLWYDSWKDTDWELDLYLQANRGGRGFLLELPSSSSSSDNTHPQRRPTHDDWVKALIASKDHVHVTFYWLTHNPSLLKSLRG